MELIMTINIFSNLETTNGPPVLMGIFFEGFTAQAAFNCTTSNKHCVAGRETSQTWPAIVMMKMCDYH